MTEQNQYICEDCNKAVGFSKLPIYCDECYNWFHGKCEKLSVKDWQHLGNSNTSWFCEKCTKSCFPFYQLDDDELLECIYDMTMNLMHITGKCKKIEDRIKSICNYKYDEVLSSQSNYTTLDKLNNIHEEIDKSFSILHMNCRSIKSSFDKIVNFLHCSDFKVKVLGLTETWMNDEKGDTYNQYNIHGYSVYNVNRIKRGGGVALYINDVLQHKSIKELSYSIADCFDVVTIEIKENQNECFYVSCIYRPPNVCMKYFLENYSNLLQKMNGKKVFICGDFNIDLIKSDVNVDTNNFLNLVYNHCQYPLISLPTRIT